MSSSENKVAQNEYIATMPNFFVVKNDAVEYMIDGSLVRIYVKNSKLKTNSVLQMVECGLNHFLEYWYHKDIDMYDKICLDFYSTFAKISGFIYNLTSKNKSVYEKRQEMIDTFCYPNSLMSDAMIYYVIDLTVCTIDRNDATTEVTVTNDMATVFAVISFYFKYLSIFSEMNPEIAPKESQDAIITACRISEKLVSQCINDIVNYKSDDPYIMNKVKEIFELEEGESIDGRSIKNALYAFITDRSGVIRARNTTFAFDEKYMGVGYDGNWSERLAVASVFGACRKFSAPIETEELIKKYTRGQVFVDINKKMTASSVFYKMGCDYNDFKFVTKQAAAYMQMVLGETSNRVTTKKTVPNINVNVILNADSEAIRKQEVALIEDSKLNLYDMRVETCQTQFRDLARDLALLIKKHNIPGGLKPAEAFSLDKPHKLNAYILSKIYLSLSGERDIYKDVFGVYSKLYLYVFYLRIVTEPKYEKYRNIAECMRMYPSIILGDANKEFIEEFIVSHDLNPEILIPFQNICRGYSNQGTEESGNIGLDEFYEFFMFMKNPYNVRHIMHPNIYSNVVPTKKQKEFKNKEVIEECLKHIL